MTSPEDIPRLIREYQRLSGQTTGSGNSTITVNAGGVGVWLACSACAIMLACGLVGAIWLSNEFRRYDNELTKLQARDKAHDAYVQSIWRAAPHLKPKEIEDGR